MLMLVILLFVHFSFSPVKIYVKDCAATTATRILKFNTNIGYDLLYCVRENQCVHVYHFLNLSIFLFLPIKFFITDFSAPVRARVFKFCIHLQTVEVDRVKENHNSKIYFAFSFHFFFRLLLHCNA